MGCLGALLSAPGVLSMGPAPKLSDGLRSCSSRGPGLSVCFADIAGAVCSADPYRAGCRKPGMPVLTKVRVPGPWGKPCVLIVS